VYIHDLGANSDITSGHALACESVTERSDQQGRDIFFGESISKEG
jgi:hypothetical protein